LKIVVALGGNALEGAEGDRGYNEQMRNVRIACGELVELIKHGHQPIITHGNGPQVGDLAVQQEIARDEIPEKPLHILGAMTQGEIGSMIQRTLIDMLSDRAGTYPVASLVTHTLVDAHDPAFATPTKPIGPFYDEETGRRLAKERQITVARVNPQGARSYRRVVPSPEPQRLVEAEVIRRIVEAGISTISTGGGGIPVVVNSAGELEGVDVVIDKDLAAEKLAEDVGADCLLILTNIDSVRIDFGKSTERPVSRMTLEQADAWKNEGQFPAGSMLPKVVACTRFIEQGGSMAVIARLGSAVQAIEGKAGTSITR
jgi:carbamate kinase